MWNILKTCTKHQFTRTRSKKCNCLLFRSWQLLFKKKYSCISDLYFSFCQRSNSVHHIKITSSCFSFQNIFCCVCILVLLALWCVQYTQLALVQCFYTPFLVEICGLYWWRPPDMYQRPGKNHLQYLIYEFCNTFISFCVNPFGTKLWTLNPYDLKKKSVRNEHHKAISIFFWFNRNMSLIQHLTNSVLFVSKLL